MAFESVPVKVESSRWLEQLKRLWQLALPIMGLQVLQSLNGVADTIIAGQFSKAALAQVAMGSGFWMPLLVFGSGLFSGTSALTAYALGAGQSTKVRQLLSASLVLVLLVSVVVIIGLSFVPALFDTFQIEPALQGGVDAYLTQVGYGLPGFFLFAALRGWAEGLRWTRPTVLVAAMALLFNVCLSYSLVFGHGPWPPLGAVGCGIATAITFWLLPIVMGLLMWRQGLVARYQKEGEALFAQVHGQTIIRLCQVGGPVALSAFVEASFFCVIVLGLAPLGVVNIAAHQIALSVSSTLFMIPLGLNFALTVAVGEAFGANDTPRVLQLIRVGMGLSLSIALSYALLLWLARGSIVLVFTRDAAVAALAVDLLALAAIFQIPDGVQVAFNGILKGLQDTFIPMFISLSAYWVIGAPIGYYLVFFGPWPLEARGAWIGLIIGLSFASAIYSVRLYLKIKKLGN